MYIFVLININLSSKPRLVWLAKGWEEWEGVADKEAYTIHTTNINLQDQYFVAQRLISCVCNVFRLHSKWVSIPSTRKLVT